jgi:molybdenum-dependent DNA-binding transcriptional regulator ModE
LSAPGVSINPRRWFAPKEGVKWVAFHADYIRGQLRQELDLDLPVHPVSAVGTREALLIHWFEQEIEPLLVHHRALVEMSLRRKTAHLRESVIATLETLLSRRRGGDADGRARIDDRFVWRLLEEADKAMREAQERCRDWTADEPALLEDTLDRAAQAIMSPAAGAGGAPLADAARQVLARRGQAAHELVIRLQQALGQTLEALRQAAPQVQADDFSVRDVAFRGLPTPEVPPLDTEHRIGPVWWGAVLPSLAVSATRRQLAERLGTALREQLDLHDRQVHAWLKESLARLLESYESQAEVFREKARSRVLRSGSAATEGDSRELEADLQELRRTEAALPEAARSPTGS